MTKSRLIIMINRSDSMAFQNEVLNTKICWQCLMFILYEGLLIPMKVKTKCLHFALLTITKSQQGRTKIVVFAETKIFGRIFVIFFGMNAFIHQVTFSNSVILLRMNLFFAQTSNKLWLNSRLFMFVMQNVTQIGGTKCMIFKVKRDSVSSF